jgi:hypothetical protein
LVTHVFPDVDNNAHLLIAILETKGRKDY